MNESKTDGIFDQTKGKIKQAFGEATNNESVANEGAADQVKGHAEESWGNVKDTAHNLSNSDKAQETRVETHEHAANFRDKVTHAAESVKDSIKHGLDNLEHKAND